MKRLISLLFVIIFFLKCVSQNDSIAPITNESTRIDSISPSESLMQENTIPTIQKESELTRIHDIAVDLFNLQLEQRIANRYKIYPTENIYNLIKLDTQTGRLYLVQWSLDSDEEFSLSINDNDLSQFKEVNSFELYPTKNIYQFILLDKATGRNWHVQWGFESSKRWIRRIY